MLLHEQRYVTYMTCSKINTRNKSKTYNKITLTQLSTLLNRFYFLQTCVPNEDLKQDQSIDEIDDLVHNNEMASTLDMSPMLLNECITNSKYWNERVKRITLNDISQIAFSPVIIWNNYENDTF